MGKRGVHERIRGPPTRQASVQGGLHPTPSELKTDVPVLVVNLDGDDGVVAAWESIQGESRV